MTPREPHLPAQAPSPPAATGGTWRGPWSRRSSQPCQSTGTSAGTQNSREQRQLNLPWELWLPGEPRVCVSPRWILSFPLQLSQGGGGELPGHPALRQQPPPGGEALHGGDPDVSCRPCTEDGSPARILQLSPPPCEKTPGSWEAGREGTKNQGENKSVQVLWDQRHSWKSVMEQSWIQHPGLSQELELPVPGAKGRAGPWSLSCSWCQVPQGLQHPARAPPAAPGAEPQGLLLQTNPQGTPTLPPSVPVPGGMLGFPQFEEVRIWLCHHLSPSQAPAFWERWC